MGNDMKFDESIYINIQKIYHDLQLLQDGHFYEHDKVSGNPSYQTLAKRMKEHLMTIEKAIKEGEKQ